MADGNHTTAIDGHRTSAADAFGAVPCSLHIDGTAVNDDAVIGTQTVQRSAIYINLHTGTDANIIVTADAASTLGKNVQLSLAAEDDLSFTEERRLLVLLVNHDVIGAVLQAVGRAVGENHIQRFAALVVDGSTIGIGNLSAIQQDLEALVAVELQRTVDGLSADNELHRSRHVHDRDMGAIGLYYHTRNRPVYGNRLTVKIDMDDLVPGTVFHIVVVGRVILVGHRDVGSLAQVAVIHLDADWLHLVLGDDVLQVGVITLARCQGKCHCG